MNDYMRNFESLGSNCEFGFVSHWAGVTEGSLFKWCLVDDFSHLISALDAKFDGLYQGQNLTPRTETMVRDRRFGLNFHTKLKIGLEDGLLMFSDPKEEWARVFEAEQHKMNYLVDKFLDGLRTQQKIYVMRANTEIPVGVAETVLRTLRRIGHCSLIVMRQADSANPPGTVRSLSPGLYEGFVAYISTDPALQDIQCEGWFETCRNAWNLHAEINGINTQSDEGAGLGEAPESVPEGFDSDLYLLANPDIVDIGMSAAQHYLAIGWKERRPLR